MRDIKQIKNEIQILKDVNAKHKENKDTFLAEGKLYLADATDNLIKINQGRIDALLWVIGEREKI